MDAAIILARIDSTRFPAKAVSEVGGKLLIQHCIDEVKKLDGITAILATSSRAIDDPLEQVAGQNNIQCYRGDAENVAKRVHDCVIKNKINSFARINGDSPFVRKALLSQGFRMMREGGYDLVTNLIPRKYPYGISVEIIRGDSFRKIYPEIIQSARYSEHISSVFYDQTEKFSVGKISGLEGVDYSDVRLTVDTKQDKQVIDSMFAADPNINENEIEKIVSLYHQVTDLSLT
ncbi:cytidylyltransferase domain-containing protein [Tunicatimonas pelagia]|uniref:cytidylyltransferase domain-containing protein n=1 Tax=Tunicatimonas pelagia TaxID=931531 RepID=UPI00266672BA|nr:hypothetical protein [Tunicatimonas pelagia]WKN43250.1 hypothetical protein P0M28_29850 [Tunicatimonas pelagia]